MRYNPKWVNGIPQGTLCNYCNNSVPFPLTGRGCSWSRDLQPVAGWTAISVIRYAAYKHQPFESFCVTKCPRFDEERYRYHDHCAEFYDGLVADEDEGVAS